MPAAAADLNRDRRAGRRFGYPVGAGKVIYRGALAAITAAAVLVPAGTAGAVAVAGIASRKVDNSASATATTTPLPLEDGIWAFPLNDFIPADIGQPAYVVDDSTLSRDSSSGTRLRGGTVRGIEGGMAYVEI